VLNLWCQAAAVLPPEVVHLNNHNPTVIGVSRLPIGKARAPKRFSKDFITVQPEPVPFPTYDKLCTFFILWIVFLHICFVSWYIPMSVSPIHQCVRPAVLS
jgi:hypothetical protein